MCHLYLPHLCFIPADSRHRFASFGALVDHEDLRFDLSDGYAIPRLFWTPLCSKSNGFFGCKTLYDIDGNIEGHSTAPL